MKLKPTTAACSTCRRSRDCMVGKSGGLASTGQSLIKRVEVVSVGNGLSEPSDQGQLVGILRSGLLRLDRIDSAGARHMLGLVLPGEPVGELLPTRLPHTVTALIDSRICRFRTGSDMDFSNLTPDLRRHLLQSYSVRLARLQSVLWIRTMLIVDARVAALLLMASRFMQSCPGPEGGTLLKFTLPRRDAADLLSTTVETFCRALHSLDDVGLIVIHDACHFELRDRDGLKKMSSLDESSLKALFPDNLTGVGHRARRLAKPAMPSTPHRFAHRTQQERKTTPDRLH